MITFYISFSRDGKNWTRDLFFKRGLYDENPLDESLDTSIVVDVPNNGDENEGNALLDIKPFTLCRIRAYDQSQNLVLEKYYFTSNVENEAITTFDN